MSNPNDSISDQVFTVENDESVDSIEIQEYKDDTPNMLDERVQSEPGDYRGMQGSTTG